jgi:PKD repeat protein
MRKYVYFFVIVSLLFMAGQVYAQSPIANFSTNVNSTEVNSSVQFYDNSTGSPTSWAWFFGDEKYNQSYVQMNGSSGWPPRSGFASAALQDGSILIMGGFNNTGYVVRDVWRSTTNGATWALINSSPGWAARGSFEAVVLQNGTVVIMGGSGNSGELNDVWASPNNGYTWNRVTASAEWPAKYNFRSVILSDNSIVIAGGQNDTLPYPDMMLNDVWRSTNAGRNWTCLNTSAGWDPRIGHGLVRLPNNDIILTGGVNFIISYPYFSDVWKSSDFGTTWALINSSPGWEGRDLHNSIAMPDGSIILTAGNARRGLYSYAMFNDTWRSTNGGVTWSQINSSAQWLPRAGAGAVLIPNGSVILMGGNDFITGLYFNDTWLFSPATSFLQNPAYIYSIAGNYSPALTAYNSSGYNTTRKINFIDVTNMQLAMFTQNLNTVRVPNRVTFTDISTGATSWDWNFGDGTANVSTQSPTHQYVKRGVFKTTLIVNSGASFNTSSIRVIGWDFSL